MHLFAYGTLMVPEIWRRITGRDDAGVAGVASGFQVRRVVGDVYPVMLRREDAAEIARGLVYFDITDMTWTRLDQYESYYYERVSIDVSLRDGVVAACQSFVVPDSRSWLASDEAWNLEWFTRDALAEYLSRLV